jgi:hypothetical protein
MKNIITLLCLFLILTTHTFANCLPLIQNKIEQKETKLLKAKLKEKKILKRTFVGVGVPSAVFWGVMFKLIADGATIPAALLVGGSFGVTVGAGAVAVVAVPMITYNQIIKSQIKSFKKTHSLILDASLNNYDSKQLKKLLKKLNRKSPTFTMEELVSEINHHNIQQTFCPEQGEKIFSFSKIKKLLMNEGYHATDSEVEVVLVDGSDERISLEINSL